MKVGLLKVIRKSKLSCKEQFLCCVTASASAEPARTGGARLDPRRVLEFAETCGPGKHGIRTRRFSGAPIGRELKVPRKNIEITSAVIKCANPECGRLRSVKVRSKQMVAEAKKRLCPACAKQERIKRIREVKASQTRISQAAGSCGCIIERGREGRKSTQCLVCLNENVPAYEKCLHIASVNDWEGWRIRGTEDHKINVDVQALWAVTCE